MAEQITQEQFIDYMKNPILFPPAFKDWISDYFATNIPKLHVSQIYGFKLHSVKSADEVTSQSTINSTSYMTASPDGPTLTDIPNGFYLAFFGASFGGDFGAGFSPIFDNTTSIYMTPRIDGSTPNDDDAAILNAGSGGRVVLLDLTDGDHQHTIDFRYKYVGSSAARMVRNRWLHVIKVVTDT